MRRRCALLLVLAGCASSSPGVERPRLATRSLPGFSIDLPEGKVDDEDIADYGNGVLKVQATGGEKMAVTVSWEDSPIETDQEAAQLARLMNRTLGAVITLEPTSEFAAGGLPIRSFVGENDQVGVAMTLIVCASRELTVTTGGDVSAFRQLHRDIVATVRCTPDPAGEKTVGAAPPVVIDLPEGWVPFEAELGQVAWALGDDAAGQDGAALFQYVQFDPDHPHAERVLDQTLQEFQISSGITGKERVGGRTIYRALGEFEGIPMGVYLVVFDCGRRQAMGIYFGLPDEDPLATRVLSSARCQ